MQSHLTSSSAGEFLYNGPTRLLDDKCKAGFFQQYPPGVHFSHKPIPETYPSELATLGDHMRKRRLDLGLLQKEVATRVGCDTATITNWELNHSSHELRFLPRIIAFVGYDPCDRGSGTLGERIVACRQRMGLSQKKFALQLGIDPTTVAGWERGEHQPSERLRASLQRFLAHCDGLESTEL